MEISLRDRLVGLLAPFPRLRARLYDAHLESVDETTLEESLMSDLQTVHDVLSEAGAIDTIWVWSGLLLGWAREGGLLSHDLRDADFCVRRADIDQLEQALQLLKPRAFAEQSRYINNEGLLSEIVLRSNWAMFEFFVVDETDGFFETRAYGIDRKPTEFIVRVPAQPLASFDLADRTWSKVADHDLELSALYGNWRVPEPGFSFMRQSPAIVARRPWKRRKEFVAATRPRPRRR